MLGLHYANESFDSAVALYSIVHFDYEQIEIAFREIRRVLKDNGSFLFSFHIGDKVLHLDDFLEHSVDIEFYFFDIEKIVALLSSAGFDIIDIIERNPYPGVEYPSQRAYIWAKKPALPLK
jgi:SAM-dependent methyltransferase